MVPSTFQVEQRVCSQKYNIISSIWFAFPGDLRRGRASGDSAGVNVTAVESRRSDDGAAHTASYTRDSSALGLLKQRQFAGEWLGFERDMVQCKVSILRATYTTAQAICRNDKERLQIEETPEVRVRVIRLSLAGSEKTGLQSFGP